MDRMGDQRDTHAVLACNLASQATGGNVSRNALL